MLDGKTRASCEATIGRVRESVDSMAPETAAKFAVLLSAEAPEVELPPTWHWLYFSRAVTQADLGHDFHERTGRFLPAVPFPRRMWASGAVTVEHPLRLGLPATQRIEIADVAFKDGRSGSMCFVTLSLEIRQDDRRCIEETRVIVYRDRGAPETPLGHPGDLVPDGFHITPDSKLFFYSAITHNGHRIHWDREYCRDEEGYPDLVVQGPMMATELCDALRGGTTGPCRYIYRAQAPVFARTPIRIEAGPPGGLSEGRILRSDGVASMSASFERL